MRTGIVIAGCAVSLALATTAWGSAFRVPEQSINGVARANAYGAAPTGADASYYNPAAMSWLAEGWNVEAGFLYINLPSISYTDAAAAANNGSSKEEQFLLPSIHLVSPAYGRVRFGFSVAYPFGLSKRWDDAFPRSTAEDFTLKTYEFNPTVAVQLTDRVSLGGGLRIVHASGEVRSMTPTGVGRNLEGDTTEYGWNLAASFRATDNLLLAATYRNQVDLKVDGNAAIAIPLVPNNYSGPAEVEVPTPDVLTLSGAYTFGATTVELTWDRTFWSSYEQLDFNYAVDLPTFYGPQIAALPSPPVPAATIAALQGAVAAFERPLPKNWDDADAFRISVSHKLNDAWTIMAGFALDETPVPANTLGFELPDSDAKIYSLGVTYQANDNLKLGCSYLYDDKDSRTVNNRTVTNTTAPSGTFDDSSAHLVAVGLWYRF